MEGELFDNSKKKRKSLSSRQKEVLQLLKEHSGSYAKPYRPKDPKKARRYSVQKADGTILIPSLKRMVIDNLYKIHHLKRMEDKEGIKYVLPDLPPMSTLAVPGEMLEDIIFMGGEVGVDINSMADVFLSKHPYNENVIVSDIAVISESEYELKNNLDIVRQQLNG